MIRKSHERNGIGKIQVRLSKGGDIAMVIPKERGRRGQEERLLFGDTERGG